ncbi:uncharacterized protein LOC108937637 [Scleropages formosus]|uniref:uncharacterized protein LOC108937637 n=1 Tax=Scleropages formosus TaxID=113540 RepID=UPI0008787060|nr:uncharacterized protein LOC108937637 [Scleropages formosus]
MGNLLSFKSKEEKLKEVACQLYDHTMHNKVYGDPLLPDVSIDKSLLEFSHQNSISLLYSKFSVQLQCSDWQEQLKRLGSKVPGLVKDAGTKLASYTPFPLAVGLGAIVISMLCEKILDFHKSDSESSALLLLQRIFAEEKEMEVKNLMEEYLKRHMMYVFDMKKVQEELVTMERQLSFQLTRLKNSMKDGNMSSRSLKIWVNGAAFHVQMLIHLVRLGQGDSTPVQAAIQSYQEDVEVLLNRYKEYKATTIIIEHSPFALFYIVKNFTETVSGIKPAGFLLGTVAGVLTPIPAIYFNFYRIKDKELGKEVFQISVVDLYSDNDKRALTEAFLDHMFSNFEQITRLKEYFSTTANNLDKLIAEQGDFDILKVSPSLESTDDGEEVTSTDEKDEKESTSQKGKSRATYTKKESGNEEWNETSPSVEKVEKMNPALNSVMRSY